MHDVHSPVLALFVQDLSPRLRSQFWHAPNHVGVPLQEISLLEMSQVYVGEILSQIICLELNVGSMSLRLVIVVTWLSLMVISWKNFGKRVLLLESPVHPSRLVPSIIKVTIVHVESELWWLKVAVAICHRISLPIFWDFSLQFGVRFSHFQILEVFFWWLNKVINGKIGCKWSTWSKWRWKLSLGSLSPIINSWSK